MNNAVRASLVIFLVSFLVRGLDVGKVDLPVFDERAYATFVSHFNSRKPYFDLHPPGWVMLMAGVLKTNTEADPVVEAGRGWGGFPYRFARMINAFAGAAVPVLVYWAGMLIGGNRRAAAVPAVMAAFDNSLVVFSRLVLPDVWILFWGLLGAVMFLQAGKKTGLSGLWLLGTGVCLGLAAAVKWSGWGWAGAVLAGGFWLKRPGRELVKIGVAALAVYCLVWVGFFTRFTGNRQEIFSWGGDVGKEISYPDAGNMAEIAAYIPRHHVFMLAANSWYRNYEGGSRPHNWLTGWGTQEWLIQDRLAIAGNPAGRLVATGALAAGIVYLAKKRRLVGWLYSGVAVNLLPFYFLDRSFFVYHYFPALIWQYLLAGRIFKESGSKGWVFGGLLLMLVMGFAAGLRVTYG